MTKIAEVAASLPVTNAWPERGASALKNVKTRHRNRLKNDMLEAILQVTINGPDSNNNLKAEEVIKAAVEKWLKAKDRKKLARNTCISKPKSVPTASAACQTDTVLVSDQAEIREEIRNVVQQLAIEGLNDTDSDGNISSDDQDSDSDCPEIYF